MRRPIGVVSAPAAQSVDSGGVESITQGAEREQHQVVQQRRTEEPDQDRLPPHGRVPEGGGPRDADDVAKQGEAGQDGEQMQGVGAVEGTEPGECCGHVSGSRTSPGER